ncbi:hypothetical protein UFOVP121_49 [uncultured Caudovirales phage]|uniref:Uncharacterized protein n=1 Tax=uncultured Caudovirales phage TaxID=2100421 RepID=A0A6J5LN76_9CAUD|nr:hypothetical protein UFOVP121_49 [uncultured Caudovirales phage]CAB4135032.1 hypothetical protein UFOVP277_54 [uncultured Caudovirales phage]
MRFVMLKDRVVGGTTGHFIRFIKGQPVDVPREMWSEVQAAGAVPESDLPDDEPLATTVTHDPVERQQKYFDAFAGLEERNERGDFTASGLPNSKTLEKLVGFQVVNNERDAMWEKYLASKIDAE